MAAVGTEEDQFSQIGQLAPSECGGAVPLALAATDAGTRAVEALLGRMEHGVNT